VPPLTITEEQLAAAVETLQAAWTGLRR
jgi:hypothetical protein